MKDSYETLSQSLKDYLPTFVENRQSELESLKPDFLEHNSDIILKWTHKVLGISDNYNLFELTEKIYRLEMRVKSSTSFNLIEDYESISSYLKLLSIKIAR